MSIRHLPAAVAAAMLAGFALAAPAVAQVSVQPAAAVTGMTSGRIGPSLTALVALAGVVIGRLALARSTGRIGTGNRGRMAIVAMVSGLIGVVVGGLSGHRRRWSRHRQRDSRVLGGHGVGADRHGSRRTGSGPLPPHSADRLTAATSREPMLDEVQGPSVNEHQAHLGQSRRDIGVHGMLAR